MKVNPLGLLDYDEFSEGATERGRPRRPFTGSSDRPARRAGETAGTQLGRALAGGRVSIDRTEDAFFGNSLTNFVTHNHEENIFHAERFDARALSRMPVSRLMELLADNSPEVSRALWDLLLFCNPGWEAKAYKPGTTEVDDAGQAALDEFLSNLHGPFAAPHVMPADVVIAAMFMTVGMRGSILAELVLDEAGRVPLEVATPDPATLRFRREPDPVRGRVWVVGQMQGGKFVPLDRPTVCYVPVHPFPGSPHGRSLFAPAVFSSLFLLGMLYDIKRVVQQQGYPRLDIAMDFEKLRNLLTEEVLSDVDKFNEVVEKMTEQVTKHYASLEPDDAYVHSTVIEVKQPVGAVDSRSLGAVEGLIRSLERMAVRSVKSMPLLFGISESTTETHANRQWEIHVAGIKSIQHLVEFVLERLCGLGLRARGIAAVVDFKFAELRAAEMMRDAQTEGLRINNAVRKRDEGLITQDEAAQEITGKPAAFPGPVRVSAAQTGLPGAQENPEPGSNR
jgi:hypothetical protein